jgi:hypothetical protein
MAPAKVVSKLNINFVGKVGRCMELADAVPCGAPTVPPHWGSRWPEQSLHNGDMMDRAKGSLELS